MPILRSLFYFCLYVTAALYSKQLVAQSKKQYHYYQSSSQYLLNNDLSPKDTVIQNYLKECKKNLDEKMDEIIVYTTLPLSKAQPECTLGNWITDAVRKSVQKGKQKIDACILSYSIIEKEYLAPGPIKRIDFYDLITKDNKIVLVNLDGQTLHYLCDSIAIMNGAPISGISFAIHGNKASNILINNQPVNNHMMYTIAMNDYLWQSKKFNNLFANATYKNTHMRLCNTLLEYALAMKQQNEKINTKLENRIYYAE
ncbi:MAG: 5'-nucleotidase C-terminal domain-containing protein [Bacteroidota bacterium]